MSTLGTRDPLEIARRGPDNPVTLHSEFVSYSDECAKCGERIVTYQSKRRERTVYRICGRCARDEWVRREAQ